MVDSVEIAQRLLQRLAGALSPEDLSAWARGAIAVAADEGGPTLSGADDDILRDVLKRCAVASQPGFELSGDDLRTLLRRLAFSDAPLSPHDLANGPYLSAFRAKMVPALLFPIVGNCVRCGAPVRLAASALDKCDRFQGLLACVWCARALPGAVVERL